MPETAGVPETERSSRPAAVLPSVDIAHDTGAVKAWAQAVEDLGYGQIIAYDHVLGATSDRVGGLNGPYDERDPFREPMTLFAYLAGTTRSLSFMTGVLVLPQRQTALVAKQAAEVDLLSDGRLTLGIGIGWNHVEYESLGVPFSARAARLEEQVELLRALWTQPIVNFDGRFHRVDRAGIHPRPARSIPIWFGGGTDAAVDRAARLGDGFFFTRVTDQTIEHAQRARDGAASRRPAGSAPFGLAAQVHTNAGFDTCVLDAERWITAGGTDVVVSTLRPSGAPPSAEDRDVDQHIDRLAHCADVLRDLLRPA